MKVYNFLNKLLGSVIITLLLFFAVISCRFTDKSDGNKNANFDEQEQRQVAAFLVKSTEINLQILHLSKIIQSKSTSVNVKNTFEKQFQLTSKINSDIKKIAEENLVNLPRVDVRNTIRYKNDSVSINILKNQLNKQIELFRNIIVTTNDPKISKLQSEFLPKLNDQAQKIRTLN